jgi:hypothetical protein
MSFLNVQEISVHRVHSVRQKGGALLPIYIPFTPFVSIIIDVSLDMMDISPIFRKHSMRILYSYLNLNVQEIL